MCVFLSVYELFSRLINYGHCVKCVYLQAMQLNHRNNTVNSLLVDTLNITLHCLPPPTIHCSDHLGKQLYDASGDGRVEEVERLLARGAPVNWRDIDGWTALPCSMYLQSC